MSEIVKEIMAMPEFEALTEDEALSLWHAMCRKFGWAGTLFTRDDATDAWHRVAAWHRVVGSEYSVPEGEMPDELWEVIRHSRYWNRTIPENLCERGWDIVFEAVEEALKGE